MPDFKSLRSRVALALFSLGLLVWMLGAVTTFRITQHEAEEMLDGQLAQAVRFIAALPTDEFEEVEHELGKISLPVSHYEPRTAFQVWNRKGALVFSSADAPAVSIPTAQTLGRPRTEIVDGREWRAHSIESARVGHIVQVMAHNKLDAGFALHVGSLFLRSTAFVVPLVLLLGMLALGRALRPIDRLRKEIGARDSRSTTPIAIADVPSEIGGLVEAINDLSRRHLEVLEHVRHFTADAAHELRTPIASMLMQAQVAKSEPDPEWRNAALDDLAAVGKRTTLLLDQLLALAHLDHAEIDFKREECDLAALARQVAGADAHIETNLPDQVVSARCMPALIELALRNMVSNAVKHGKAGKIVIAVEKANGQVSIAVDDSGPGIPPEHADAIFMPFFRVPGTAADGTGLGLSIVRRVAEAHGGNARVEASRTLSGARVILAFPDAA